MSVQRKIKILIETPFDSAGAIISPAEFREKYGYLFTSKVSDKELIEYLRTERELYLKFSNSSAQVIGKFFELVEQDERETIPLDFILDGIVYRKELDGMYYTFLVGAVYAKGQHLELLTIEQAYQRWKNVKYKVQVWYATRDINKLLKGNAGQ